MSLHRVTAFAPGSVANVAIGFDILGFSVDAVGDTVTLTRTEKPGVTISSIGGVVMDLPLAAEKNTAGQALLALIRERSLPFGFDVRINKGIPLASGLGGSAALELASGGSGDTTSSCLPIRRASSAARSIDTPDRSRPTT